uniref:UDP-glucose:glycoprotein glucosyltransferase n=1 Tax=Photinus pyralis TaxID=7054 RepID=A0A1Y1LFV4_PHOPY
MYFKLVISLIGCFLLLIGNASSKSKSKSVTTLLDAKWKVTPLVLEVAEYLGDENVDFYWNFIDSICNLSTPLEAIENDRERYEVIMNEVAKLVGQSELAMLKLGLSLHIYSPKIEAFAQIATEKALPECKTVVEVGDKVTCNLEDIKELVSQGEGKENLDVYHIDTHYPGSENRNIVAALYGELGTKQFAQFHAVLKELAIDRKIDYIFRHFVRNREDRQLRLSGYGVELQMKSTEYKVQDDTQIHDEHSSEESSGEEEDVDIEGFNFVKLKGLFPNRKKDLDRFKQYLEETSNEMAPLKVWQFQELSLQAAQRIMNAPKDEALKVFTNIAQNFPMQAKSLVKTVVNSDMKEEIKANQEVFGSTLNLRSSDTALFINGMFFDLDLIDFYAIFDVLRQEQRTMQGLHTIGIDNERIKSLMALDFSSTNSETQDFAIDIRDSAINWINDIEQDGRYNRWSSSVMDLLKPTFPGMLRHVRRNLFNLVLIIKAVDVEMRGVLMLLESLVVHSAPLRVGLVLSTNSTLSVNGLEDAGVAVLCAFNYVSQKHDPVSALSFLTSLYKSSNNEVTVEDVKTELKRKYDVDYDEVLGEDSAYDFGRQLTEDFIQRTGLHTTPQALINGIPLQSSQLNVNDFEEAILQEVMSQTSIFQKAIFHGKLTDKDDVIDFIMGQPNVMPRLNQRILNRDRSFYLDMSGKAQSSLTVEGLAKLSHSGMTATAVENVKYFQLPRKGTRYHSMTYWIVGNLACPKTKKLLIAALEHLKTNDDTRVSFMPNINGNKDAYVNSVVLAALQQLPSEKAYKFVLNFLRSDVDKFDVPSDIKDHVKSQELSLKMLRVYAQRVLKFAADDIGVIANGCVLGPLDENEEFTLDDFSLMDRFSAAMYGDKVKGALAKAEDAEEISSNTYFRMIPLLISQPQTKSRFDITFSGDKHSVLSLSTTNTDRAVFDIAAIVDPVSRGAQKLGPVLQILQETLNCNIRVFLNCIEKNSDMPVKSFYRYVLEPEIQFNGEGKQVPGPIARFSNMPHSVLFTQNIHVPENWLIEVVRSVYDLDNIRLENVDSVVHSEYELEYLLLEGHCFESTMGSPPRGLQITLGTKKEPIVVDTIVMSNLGYFQLKANPGAWTLRLRQGRSADLYDIVGLDKLDLLNKDTDIKVLISSLRSNVIKLKVSKKPEKYNVDLLADDDSNSGIWNSITSSLTGGEDESDEKLNIFSLASGHLYERFIRIMMLSVLKHTKTPVKFWFLKNYLSPQLKDFLPYMAKEYGFEYELVQYRWPRWLFPQTEKQRIIWGYKILFLDVLFPLDVKKIIFVDADQVVRADLKELQQLDLGGAPYGYTPFCDSRKEMDGFRFWKQGYWRTHLQGRRYHISALYVVDLKRFRRVAAGDRLRGQYQAFSQDPNSLSNLDQDLPNNMIHQVAIKSLPQEWLWCETWCDDASKAQAKTIDLCNNPMTKEAKLTAAMRIVPEWKGYDEDIRKLQQKIDSGVLDPDPVENLDTHSDRTDVHTEL